MVTIAVRPTSVSAQLGPSGQGKILAESGATAMLANLAADEGFTPLEFMDAALAGCLVLSLRIAVRKLGWQERFRQVDVQVSHEKAPEGKSRVSGFTCSFAIEGDFTAEERQQLIVEAHDICTVGNSFEHGAVVRDISPVL